MIETNLFSHLETNVQLSNGRVYPQILPLECEYPAIVYTIINDKDFISQNLGRYGSTVRIQIDCYAQSYLEAKQLKEEVKDALYSFGNRPLELNSRDMPDDSELYRQLIDLKINT